MARYIFVTGGVVSSLGKGLSSASLAYLLQSRGYRVRLRKLDPYLNVDPGTMSPFQHVEVFVTDDGPSIQLLIVNGKDVSYYTMIDCCSGLFYANSIVIVFATTIILTKACWWPLLK